ncbi:MAG: monovalent cation/H(+) antiporter subunit G [Bacillota bacterium]|nr:monovalent cation/H(+) antiporter subunit G [Bacillota bacterium]MDW7683104.1 monovalent cation/H(+) antiporter subunit G [Bacillota bacterium]
MKLVFDLFVCFLLLAGMFFLFVGVLGLVRLPDLYTRMHATSKCDTLGTGLILVALMTQIGMYNEVIKLILICAFIWTINPLVTHVIGHIAYLRDEDHTADTFFIDCYEVPFPGKNMVRKEDVRA